MGGAVATHGFWNYAPGHSGHCFPGIRAYTENGGFGANFPDFAASLSTGQWHARTPVLALSRNWGSDECTYKACPDVIADSDYQQWPSQVRFPLNAIGEAMMGIHSLATGYAPRVEVCRQVHDPLLRAFVDVARWTYQDCRGIRDGSWSVADW